MGLLSFLGGDEEEVDDRVYKTMQVQQERRFPSEELQGTLLEIKPYYENDGIDSGAALLQSLHDIQMSGDKNISDSHAFEIWFDRGEFKFRMYARNERARERFQRKVANVYTNSEVAPLDDCQALPPIPENYHIAGAYIDERRHTFIPLRNYDQEGYKFGDPYSDIMGAMLTLDDSIVVLQCVFKPARTDWTLNGPNGRSVDDLAEEFRQGEVVGMKDPLAWLQIRDLQQKEPSRKDKRTAELIEEQRGEQGFHVNLRVMAASPKKAEAKERARGTASAFTKHYSSDSGQRLTDNPLQGERDEFSHFYEKMLTREWIDREMILSIDEVAGIAHVPNKDIEVPQVPWKTTQTGSQISADAPKDQQNTAWPSDE
jgi:hypothetical protein